MICNCKLGPVKWKIDEAADLPLAIIEDNADGMGILEMGKRTRVRVLLAKIIVTVYNAVIDKRSDQHYN